MTKRSIYLVEAPTQYALASTFLRFQEHYESPKFRNQFFSLEEFMDWYAEEYGNFTYYEDWTGFNIPSHVLTPFREGKFNPLSAKERRLLDLFEKVQSPFYIIGLAKPFDLSTLKHELVHGLFYTEGGYRNRVLETVKNLDIQTFEKALTSLGYHPAVHKDEINAYAISGMTDLVEDGLSLKRAGPVQKAMRKVFTDYFDSSLTRMGEEEILNLVHRISL